MAVSVKSDRVPAPWPMSFCRRIGNSSSHSVTVTIALFAGLPNRYQTAASRPSDQSTPTSRPDAQASMGAIATISRMPEIPPIWLQTLHTCPATASTAGRFPCPFSGTDLPLTAFCFDVQPVLAGVAEIAAHRKPISIRALERADQRRAFGGKAEVASRRRHVARPFTDGNRLLKKTNEQWKRFS